MGKSVKWFISPVLLLLLFMLPLMLPLMFPQTVLAASTPTVSIITYTFNKRTITVGDSVTMTIRTNTEANHVWVRCDGVTSAATYISTNLGGLKEWTVTLTPSKTQVVFIYANTSNSLTDAVVRARNVRVEPVAVKIESMTTNKEVVTEGEEVTMSIKTNDKVNYVWAFLNNKYYLAALTSTDPSGSKNWTLAVTPLVTQTITVSANSAYTVSGMVSATTAVTVNKATVTITNVTADATDIAKGETIEITIRTNTEANYVWIECDGKIRNAKLESARTTSKTWYVTVAPSKDQKIIAYASWDDNEANAVTRTLQVYVSEDYVRINSVEPSSITAAVGETRTITVYTSSAVNYVWATINGIKVDFINTYTDNYYNERRWTYTISPLVRSEPVTIYASRYSYGTGEASATLQITLTSEPPTISLSFKHMEVVANVSAQFTAISNLAVDWVEVRGLNSSEYSVLRSNASNNQYTWTITIYSVAGSPGQTLPPFYIDAYSSAYSTPATDVLYVSIK